MRKFAQVYTHAIREHRADSRRAPVDSEDEGRGTAVVARRYHQLAHFVKRRLQLFLALYVAGQKQTEFAPVSLLHG